MKGVIIMTVIPEGTGKIKIILSSQDVKMLGITVSSLDCSNPDTRRMLRTLFKSAAKSIGLPDTSDRLLIEAYPHKDGGGVLYFTQLAPLKNEKRLHMKLQKSQAYIYEFSDGGELLNAVSRLYSGGLEKVNSQIFEVEGKFLLLLYPTKKDDLVLYEVMEFCDNFYKNSSQLRFISEHGTALTGNHAVAQVGRALHSAGYN